MAGQQFEYAFDEIGNRLSTQAGGDASGGNLRYADYDVNRLNQYERRTVPAAMDVIGAAPVGSNVTVNSNSVERRGAYYRQELSIPNSSTSVWQTVDVDVAPLGSVDKSGKVFVPKSPEMFAQDADGNLTQDGRWNYTWDAENRLIKQASRTDAPGGSERCLVFEYDYRGRRIGKKVWNGFDTTTGTLVLDERYLYDGWNLAAVINSSSALTKFFVWGLDLSGTMQGAGGVGGLLWGRMNGPAPRFAAYDGNGNVSALVNGSTGAVDAQYEYGPFGELLRATGPLARAGVFLFATKFYDWETGFYYYGYRYYDPSTGRWPSRDPLAEIGGANIYAFLQNDGLNEVDFQGLIAWGPILSFAKECAQDLVKKGLLRGFSKWFDGAQSCRQLEDSIESNPRSLCPSISLPVNFNLTQNDQSLGGMLLDCVLKKAKNKGVEQLSKEVKDEMERKLLKHLLGEAASSMDGMIENTRAGFMIKGYCDEGKPKVDLFFQVEVTIAGELIQLKGNEATGYGCGIIYKGLSRACCDKTCKHE